MPVLKAERLPLDASQSLYCMTIWFYSTIRSGGWLTAHEPTPARSVLREQIFFRNCPEKIRRWFLKVWWFYLQADCNRLELSPLFNSTKEGQLELLSHFLNACTEGGTTPTWCIIVLWLHNYLVQQREEIRFPAHVLRKARKLCCDHIILSIVALGKSAGEF